MTTSSDVLTVARRQIGIKENPAGSNRTKYGQWYGMDGQPWCAMWVSYCFYMAGLPLKSTTDKGFAYCPYGVKWFKDKSWWLNRNQTPNPGDVVFFDWRGDGIADHVGIVEKVLPNGNIQTIEGNTSPTNFSNGGEVRRCTRKRSQIQGYGRPPFNNQSTQTGVEHPPWPGDYFSLTSPNMESPDIRVWQQCMKERGWDIEVDGVYGEESEKVCRRLQEKMNLEVDGKVGPQTWDASWQQLKVSRDNLSIDKPINQVRYNLYHSVQFSGTAKNGIVRVRLYSPLAGANYQLGEEVLVNDGTWKSSYQFQTAGERKIVVDGLDANNKIVDSAEVTIKLDAEGNNDVGSVQITSPANGIELDLESPVFFKGIAQDERIKSLKLRSPFADKNFILGKDIPVSNAQWTYSFKFTTGGTRKIVAEGLDAQGNLIDSAAIEINLKSSTVENFTELKPVVGIENTSLSFRKRVIEIARELNVNPNYLIAAMSFESGGTFSPAIRNAAGSGAVGLIQFMPSTARGLGTSTADLAKMTAEKQLDYVKKYFWPYRGKLRTLEDVYMAILYPAAIGKGSNHVLFRRGSVSYQQNRGLDDEGKGYVTVADATEKVRKRFR